MVLVVLEHRLWTRRPSTARDDHSARSEAQPQTSTCSELVEVLEPRQSPDARAPGHAGALLRIVGRPGTTPTSRPGRGGAASQSDEPADDGYADPDGRQPSRVTAGLVEVTIVSYVVKVAE